MNAFLLTFLTLTSLADPCSANCSGNYDHGYYKVPVPNELDTYSQFNLDTNPQIIKTGPNISILFQLPIELTGAKNSILMTKQNDGSWMGEQVAGHCQTDQEENIQCSLKFHDLNWNLDHAKEIAQKNFPDKTEQSKRLRVIESFSSEPIGIVVYSGL